ncbi:hypothetical protein HKX48_004957, partial [Thoreauomyces humboldtii]
MPLDTTPRLRKRTVVALAAVSIIIAVLVVGLGAGLHHRHSSSPSSASNANPSIDAVATPYLSLVTSNGSHPELIASGLSGVRTLVYDFSPNLLLALVKGTQQVVGIAVQDLSVRTVLDASALGLRLTHGLAIDDEYLYASSSSNVYRWPYNRTASSAVQSNAGVVLITNINNGTEGQHFTRTLVLSPSSPAYLFVQVGSRTNVDPDSSRARIRRFLLGSYNGTAIDYSEGQLVADGIRNGVAMGFSNDIALWVAGNGPDNVDRPDVVANMVQDSPVEPVYRIDQLGLRYGYPFCFAAGNTSMTFATAPNVGMMYAWPTFMNDTVHTDGFCRNGLNAVPPQAYMPAHSAPLALGFNPISNDMLVALHGSWDRTVPAGYSVVR